MSCGRRQPPPPPPAPRRVQIRTDPRYTLSASGLPLALRQTVVAIRFSQIQGPDAPTQYEISGLAGKNFSLPKRRILNYVSDFDYFFEFGCDFFPDFPCRQGKTGEFKTGRAPPPHAEVGPQSSQSSSNLHSISLARAVTAASA